MRSPSPIAIAILAGGGSRRMGQDKAGLPWGGSTLLQHQADTLAAIETDLRLLSHRPGQALDIPAGLQPIPDPDADADLGPLTGITACLAAAAPRSLLVLAVDMPLMTADILRRLIRPETGACFRHRGRYETLAASYPAAALPVARRRLDARDLALQGFVQELVDAGMMTVLEPNAEEQAALGNINTMGDLERLSQVPTP